MHCIAFETSAKQLKTANDTMLNVMTVEHWNKALCIV